jgi:hypothetical protein
MDPNTPGPGVAASMIIPIKNAISKLIFMIFHKPAMDKYWKFILINLLYRQYRSNGCNRETANHHLRALHRKEELVGFSKICSQGYNKP